MKEMATMPILSIYLIWVNTLIVHGWHDLSNTDYHCWPLSADADNAVPFSSCPGTRAKWTQPPPARVKADESFTVVYEFFLEEAFWNWAVLEQLPFKHNFFRDANYTGIRDARKAKEWCIHTECPVPKLATVENCCVHHINVHSCPLAHKHKIKHGLCGPWIPAEGSIITHSQVYVGNITSGNWTSVVKGLSSIGEHSLIAHFKVAEMHFALEKRVTVVPRTVCGDGVCETDDKESCSNCPADCGRCPLKYWEIALIVAACVLLLAIFLAVVGYFKYQQEKLLWDESWIIKYSDIKADNSTRGFMGSRVNISASKSRLSINSDGDKYAPMAAVKQVFTKIGILNGRTVAIKDLEKKHFSLTKPIRKEVKQVRELDHPNIVKFVGGCVTLPHIALITEYCPKGSLADVLLNDDVPLNWSFRFSFVMDIVRGMHYLHQHKLVHGRLKSSNCIIDDRWSVKIADYGLPLYRSTIHRDESTPQTERDQVYLSPELLKLNTKPTHASDVYAFAIILVEIATRNDPYGDCDASTVPKGWKPPLPVFTLQSSKTDTSCPCPVEYNTLVEQCWHDNRDERPSFARIRKIVYRINPSRLGPVDLMMAMMEKYSKHLEQLVSERTVDLQNEKQKTDKLLHSMLPKTIADSLRQGNSVEAEWFDTCTIFFSDIVGFTNLSGTSTPIEIVEMLNKLYITFDNIIDQHDVYKVETIGDAYMIVSGVPVKNGDNHAKEIAAVSLDLVQCSKVFVIPHKPKQPMKIRVGIHTGPVCAGVVGLKMPRYCLFGDTVNTASRMESNGEAYKIHTSNTTHDLLEKLGGFQFEERGPIQIKGKGEMITWWLTGQNTAGNENKGKGITS